MKSLTTEGTFMIRESKERGQQVIFTTYSARQAALNTLLGE